MLVPPVTLIVTVIYSLYFLLSYVIFQEGLLMQRLVFVVSVGRAVRLLAGREESDYKNEEK